MFLEFLNLLPFVYLLYVIVVLLSFGLITEILKFNSIKVIYFMALGSLLMLLTLIKDELEVSLSFLGQKDNIFMFGFFVLIVFLIFILLFSFKHFMTAWL